MSADRELVDLRYRLMRLLSLNDPESYVSADQLLDNLEPEGLMAAASATYGPEPSPEPFTERLQRYLKGKAPQLVGDLDGFLQKADTPAKQKVMMGTLVSSYGPEPEPPAMPEATRTKEFEIVKLRQFYQEKGVERSQSEISGAVDRYIGSEKMKQQVWKSLEEKYGAPGSAAPPSSPSFTEAAAAPSSSPANPPQEQPQPSAQIEEELRQFYTSRGIQKSDDEVRNTVRRFEGRHDEMFEGLYRKYGGDAEMPPTPQPGESPPVSSSKFHEDPQQQQQGSSEAELVQFDENLARMKRFYAKYLPDKPEEEIRMAAMKFEGNYEPMWIRLVEKYGPEPEVNVSVAGHSEASPSFDANLARMKRFYAKYQPDKPEEEMRLAASKFDGNYEPMWARLVEKYGPEPAVEVSSAPAESLAAANLAQSPFDANLARMKRFYAKYQPDKPEEEMRMAASKFDGNYEPMWARLVEKYGPEPAESDGRRSEHSSVGRRAAEVLPLSPFDANLARMKRFYAKYQPDKPEEEMRTAAAKFDGNYEPLWTRLVEKYGPEPPADAPTVEKASTASTPPVTAFDANLARMKRFYAKYQPDKPEEEMRMAASKFDGNYEPMWARLVEKYGPEPAESDGRRSEQVAFLENSTDTAMIPISRPAGDRASAKSGRSVEFREVLDDRSTTHDNELGVGEEKGSKEATVKQSETQSARSAGPFTALDSSEGSQRAASRSQSKQPSRTNSVVPRDSASVSSSGASAASAAAAADTIVFAKWMEDSDKEVFAAVDTFYAHYCPAKTEADAMVVMRKFSFTEGGYDAMWTYLESKYGPREIKFDPRDGPPRSQRERLREFYARYCPSKTKKEIQAILVKYHKSPGGYDHMWTLLERKYGPEVKPLPKIAPRMVQSDQAGDEDKDKELLRLELPTVKPSANLFDDELDLPRNTDDDATADDGSPTSLRQPAGRRLSGLSMAPLGNPLVSSDNNTPAPGIFPNSPGRRTSVFQLTIQLAGCEYWPYERASYSQQKHFCDSALDDVAASVGVAKQYVSLSGLNRVPAQEGGGILVGAEIELPVGDVSLLGHQLEHRTRMGKIDIRKMRKCYSSELRCDASQMAAVYVGSVGAVNLEAAVDYEAIAQEERRKAAEEAAAAAAEAERLERSRATEEEQRRASSSLILPSEGRTATDAASVHSTLQMAGVDASFATHTFEGDIHQEEHPPPPAEHPLDLSSFGGHHHGNHEDSPGLHSVAAPFMTSASEGSIAATAGGEQRFLDSLWNDGERAHGIERKKHPRTSKLEAHVYGPRASPDRQRGKMVDSTFTVGEFRGGFDSRTANPLNSEGLSTKSSATDSDLHLSRHGSGMSSLVPKSRAIPPFIAEQRLANRHAAAEAEPMRYSPPAAFRAAPARSVPSDSSGDGRYNWRGHSEASSAPSAGVVRTDAELAQIIQDDPLAVYL